MVMLYLGLVFLHVASILLLLLMHGTALAVSYAIRDESHVERLTGLLDLSRLTFDSGRFFGRVFWIDLLVVIASGIALMAVGGFWRQGWTWASMVVFVAIMGLMARLGSAPMGSIRRAAGLPWVERQGLGKPTWHEGGEVNAGALAAATAAVRPGLLTAIGAGGFLLILALMVFKPF